MKIQYLKNQEIDIELWDACVKHSLQGFPYAYSFYLNIVAPGFSGIILNDYEAILPLPTKKKWSIQYVYHPMLCQQLGIVSKKELDTQTINNMVNIIPAKIKFINYNVSYNLSNNGKFIPLDNYVLHLNKPYKSLLAGYKPNTRRYIKIALKNEPEIVNNPPTSSIIKLIQQTTGKNDLMLNNDTDYGTLEKLLEKLYTVQLGSSVGIYDDGGLSAVVYYIKTEKRVVKIITASTASAKKNNWIAVLIDHIIKKYNNTNLVFDFEGSNIPSVAHFFRNFGSEKTVYYNWQWNRLPFPLNYLK